MSKRILFIDFETRSEVDIKDVGAHRYCMDANTEMVLVSYAFDNGQVYVCEDIPDKVLAAIEDENVLKVAHNAEFDMSVCKYVLGIDISFDDWFDTAYQAAYYGFPRALAHLANTIGTHAKASPEEMKLFATPASPSRKATSDDLFPADVLAMWNTKETHPEEWERFLLYSMGDITAMREAFYKMPMLPEIETFTMRETFRMNFNGVPFDAELASKIFALSQEYSVKAGVEARERYNVDNLRSTKQVLDVLRGEGIYIDSLDKKKRGDVTHELIDLRDQATGAAFSKIPTAFERLCPDGRLRGEFVGHGAHTGRWSSRGVQLQNWKRIKSKVTPDLSGVESYDHLSQHMRLCLGYTPYTDFTYGDLSQIEARIVAWLAGCKWRMEAFANGEDIYAQSAAKIFGIPGLTNETHPAERFMGKTYELALGYGGGWSAVERMSPEFFAKHGRGKVENDVVKWRKANPEIVNLWYSLQRAFVEATRVGKCEIRCGNTTLIFRFDSKTMRVALPSGRALYYRGVRVIQKEYGSPDIIYQDYSRGGEYSVTSRLWGGTLLENITQAIAKDVLIEVIRKVKIAAPWMDLIGTVHDEIWYLNRRREGVKPVDILLTCMSEPIKWAPGLVTKGEGFTSERYKK